ncbi:MAG: MBL fold metallo-hydrolase [Actinobacteria bacterium]|nr:MBL fold metallo-hydrolase [Actinomycetota bacterium]
MEIHAIRTPSLGDTTYLVFHDGLAMVVDPQRDIDRFEDHIAASGADLRLVLETHLHNDYLSGGRHLAKRAGAELVMPAGAAPVFRHRPAFHHEDIDLGSLVVRPIHTPGHTPEHVSYLLVVDGRAEAVFTGGSLLVGTAGRTDLLGRDRAETLARLQFGSVRRLAMLPDHTRVCPTHGAGSFCTVGTAGRSESNIGDEKLTNTALAHADEEAFVATHLSGLTPYPDYYRHMGPMNLAGPEPMPEPSLEPIGEDGLRDLGEDVVIVDTRPAKVFAAGHIPGSLGVELRSDFGVWVGWMVPFGSPLVLVTEKGHDVSEAVTQLARVGFDRVLGFIDGLDEWKEPLQSYRVAAPDEFAEAAVSGAQMVDTRAPSEWQEGTIGGASLLYVPDVAAKADTTLDPERPVWVACASGYRAGITASLLEARGFEPVVLAGAGIPDVLRAMADND